MHDASSLRYENTLIGQEQVMWGNGAVRQHHRCGCIRPAESSTLSSCGWQVASLWRNSGFAVNNLELTNILWVLMIPPGRIGSHPSEQLLSWILSPRHHTGLHTNIDGSGNAEESAVQSAMIGPTPRPCVECSAQRSSCQYPPAQKTNNQLFYQQDHS